MAWLGFFLGAIVGCCFGILILGILTEASRLDAMAEAEAKGLQAVPNKTPWSGRHAEE